MVDIYAVDIDVYLVYIIQFRRIIASYHRSVLSTNFLRGLPNIQSLSKV